MTDVGKNGIYFCNMQEGEYISSFYPLPTSPMFSGTFLLLEDSATFFRSEDSYLFKVFKNKISIGSNCHQSSMLLASPKEITIRKLQK